MIDNFDPNKLYGKLVKAGNAWADKEAAASFLEETKKTVLAELVTNCQPGISHALAEKEALANQKYRDHVDSMVTARKEANKAKIKYLSIQTWTDLKRTQESTQRAVMRNA